MYDEDSGFGQKFAPVNVGDEIDVKIEAVGEKGDGIAKKEGFVLFVPNTKEGQEVKIKVTKVLRKVGFAEVVGDTTPKEGGETPAQDAQPEGAHQETEEPEESKVEDTEDFGEEKKE
jgi:predicted RNA-binding protein with TRAM domain